MFNLCYLDNRFYIDCIRFIWRFWSFGFWWYILKLFIFINSIAQSIVAPLGSLTLVVNFVLAPLMHGEKLGWVDFMWTAVIIAGCTVSVAFASHEESEYNIIIVII